ncbi:sulfatase-like hydrolase/transferase [Natrinema sp. SYSU A 869]|uniref:sulfatase-like hydrolase/transferase n=1 Tax=Natrinema sp. SYSU A 869 TaxID=2871694 RepID=UPI001CA408A2|nr:sulfatase-like hydrolase/transferase [Natrinema sp. SYSU A 869]
MSAARPLTAALEALEVENVFVYVGDAVRWDAVPDRVTDRAATVRTVSASTHSPSSFASLATGRYAMNHGVVTFDRRLPSDVFRLFDVPGHETRFLNSIFAYAQREHGNAVDPIHTVLDVEPPAVDDPLEGLESPFVAMERGPGGHAPYGDFAGTASEYFQRRGGADAVTLRDEYRRSVELDIDLFFERLTRLEEARLAEETLVIYTSDHGELLGEGGELGHSSPMRPELVYVPTAFFHPELPATTVNDAAFHHADLLPTILDVLGVEPTMEQSTGFDGRSAARALADEPRPCTYENRVLPSSLPFGSGSLHYEGVWDAGGGYAFARTPLPERLLVLAGKAVASAKRGYVRRHLPHAFGAYASGGASEYGEPAFTERKATQLLERVAADSVTGEQVDLSADAEQRLQDLGYT